MVRPDHPALPPRISTVDAARFLILYKHGGVYADMDMEVFGPLNGLLGNHSMMLTEPAETVRRTSSARGKDESRSALKASSSKLATSPATLIVVSTMLL